MTLVTQRTRTVTFVLPVLNEASTLPPFHDALLAATDRRPDLSSTFVSVDDGFLSGLESTTRGVIGSYLGRVYDETRARPLHSVALTETGPATVRP